MKTIKLLGLVALGLLLTSRASVKADALIYEGFNGYTTGNLVGQTTINTTGLTGSYQSVAGQLNYTASGLSFGDLVVSGGAVTSNAVGNAAIGVSFASSIANTTGTIYSSYLAQVTNVLATGALYMGVGSSATATSANREFDSFALDSSGGRKVATAYSAGNSSTVGSYASAFAANTTYAIVARYTNVGTALTSGNKGVATVWVLTLDQFTNFSSGGFTDAELDGATLGTGATSVFGLATQSYSPGTFLFDNTKALQFAVSGGLNEYSLDEMRYGTSLNDVLPLTTPEPSTIVMSVIGGVVLLGMRRKRI